MADTVCSTEERQCEYFELREKAAELLDHLEYAEKLQRKRGLPKRERTVELRALSWTPYDRQRRILQSVFGGAVSEWAVIAARQTGKTDLAVYATIRVMLEEPGSYSVLLGPTKPHARTAIDKMRRLCSEIPGSAWKEQQGRLVFANGSVWQVISAERGGDVGRGPTLDGLLWVDEAALVNHAAWMSTLGSLGAVRHPRKLLTTTPKGKNWVWKFFTLEDIPPEERGDSGREVFRFRAEESPFANLREITRLRRLMTPEMAAQEFDAEFVDALILAFPDISRLFTSHFRDRSKERDPRNTLGIDLGKDQDWTVCTLMNKYGEAEVLGRWQHTGWPETEARILEIAKSYGVELFVVDASWVGGYLVGQLEKAKHEVLPVKTHILGAKAAIVEQARADVQHGRITVKHGPHTDQLEHELKRFQGTKHVQHGVERVRYEGVQLRGEFDDCVISLCLANWGREHGWTKDNPLSGDFSGFLPKKRPTGPKKFGGFGGLPASGLTVRRAA